MLCVTRKTDEEIVIRAGSDVIVVRLLEIRDRVKVRIGIIADDHIKVDRREVYEAKLASLKLAANQTKGVES